MNGIDHKFAWLKTAKLKGIIAYLTAGDPDLETTEAIVQEMARRGADMVELGVPFSDPVADGPVIQSASKRALAKGVTLEDVLKLAGRLKSRVKIPLLIMSYYNPIFSYGLSKFIDSASSNGVDGVLVPDLPLEESEAFSMNLKKSGIHYICFLAPTSSDQRIKKTVKRSSGFIYCVSVAGITGVRDTIPVQAHKLLEKVSSITEVPLALGFGISSPEQVQSIGNHGSAAIIGSAIMKQVEQGRNKEEVAGRVGAFMERFNVARSSSPGL